MNKLVATALLLTFTLAGLPALAEEPASEGAPTPTLVRLPDSTLAEAPAGDKTAGSPHRVVADLPRRSAWLAGTMSLLAPGAGQIYNEHYVLGSLWLAAEVGLYVGAFAYSGAFSATERFQFDQMKVESVFMLVLAAGLHVYSIYDAVTEVVHTNGNIDRWNVAYDPKDDTVTVGYTFPWSW